MRNPLETADEMLFIYIGMKFIDKSNKKLYFITKDKGIGEY